MSGADVVERCGPRQWIYKNLTPWRIHACFDADGALLPRHPDRTSGHPCERVVSVLSIPALGEIKVPRDDARGLNTLSMRRLGQVEVRPAPGELMTNLPRAIVIFGWLAVGLFFGTWALFFGGGSAVPWASCVAAIVAVPVVALVVATTREIHLYRRFNRYRVAMCTTTNAEPISTDNSESITIRHSAGDHSESLTIRHSAGENGSASRSSARSRASSGAAGSGPSSTACPARSPRSPCSSAS